MRVRQLAGIGNGEKPTIGAAKSGQIGELTERDGRIVLLDKGEVIGEVVTTEEDYKGIRQRRPYGLAGNGG